MQQQQTPTSTIIRDVPDLKAIAVFCKQWRRALRQSCPAQARLTVYVTQEIALPGHPDPLPVTGLVEVHELQAAQNRLLVLTNAVQPDCSPWAGTAVSWSVQPTSATVFEVVIGGERPTLGEPTVLLLPDDLVTWVQEDIRRAAAGVDAMQAERTRRKAQVLSSWQYVCGMPGSGKR